MAEGSRSPFGGNLLVFAASRAAGNGLVFRGLACLAVSILRLVGACLAGLVTGRWWRPGKIVAASASRGRRRTGRLSSRRPHQRRGRSEVAAAWRPAAVRVAESG
jgi:hypothetical protein